MGRPLEERNRDYYRMIGVSFEFPNHYLKLTARENLELFRSLHGGELQPIEAVLELVDLADAIDVRVGEFSKGMKQRLTFARSLLHRPKLWFLDEPTAGLDPVNARRVVGIVEERRAAGVTTFLTTHDMTVADRLCDRVAFIVGGRIAVIDAPVALRRRYGRREVIVTWEEPSGTESVAFPMDGLGVNCAFSRRCGVSGSRRSIRRRPRSTTSSSEACGPLARRSSYSAITFVRRFVCRL